MSLCFKKLTGWTGFTGCSQSTALARFCFYLAKIYTTATCLRRSLAKSKHFALKHYDLTKIPDFFDNLVLIGKNLQNFANKNLGWAAVIIGIKRLLV